MRHPPPPALLQKEAFSSASATGRGGKLWGHQPSSRGKTFLVTEADSAPGLLGLVGVWDNSLEVCSPVSSCESGAALLPCLPCVWLSFPLLWEVSTASSLCLRSCIYSICPAGNSFELQSYEVEENGRHHHTLPFSWQLLSHSLAHFAPAGLSFPYKTSSLQERDAFLWQAP